MTTKIINGILLVDGKWIKTDLTFENGKIKNIGNKSEADLSIDANGCYVTAGFIDMHCHGGGGFDFNDGTYESVCGAVKTHLKFGTTTIFATITSTDTENMLQNINAIESAKNDLPSLGGIHLEGPYFSPSQMGAQNSEDLKPPSIDEYSIILKNHNIARWDYAPDRDENFEFLNALINNGTIPAAGHTDATAKQMFDAADRGCNLITHLYSCTSTIRREGGFRIAGVVEATYLRDDVKAELITDGCHLPNELIKLAYKIKGADKLALVTDAIRCAGTDIVGEFNFAGKIRIIEDGVAKMPDRTAFAGSIATADKLIRTCKNADIPLSDCIKMMTETPAKIMKLSNVGLLKEGYDADIVIFDDDINIKKVISKGKVI